MTITKRQTMEQERAAQAWTDVSNAKRDLKKTEQSEYKTRAKKLAAMIQINGLGTTMAFLCSKPKKEAYKLVYKHLSDWLLKKLDNPKEHKDLLNLIRDIETPAYRQATTEAIEFAIWMKRYVESWGDVVESEEQ